MGTTNRAAVKADFDELAANGRAIEELTAAEERRHELPPGTLSTSPRPRPRKAS